MLSSLSPRFVTILYLPSLKHNKCRIKHTHCHMNESGNMGEGGRCKEEEAAPTV